MYAIDRTYTFCLSVLIIIRRSFYIDNYLMCEILIILLNFTLRHGPCNPSIATSFSPTCMRNTLRMRATHSEGWRAGAGVEVQTVQTHRRDSVQFDRRLDNIIELQLNQRR